MKNLEKYKNALMYRLDELAITKDGEGKQCCDTKCEDCIFYRGQGTICTTDYMIEWLLKEVEPEFPKLTEFDQQYLKYCFDCGYNYIARDLSGELDAYKKKPIQNIEYGRYMPVDNGSTECYKCLPLVCKTINPRKCYKIVDLLEAQK